LKEVANYEEDFIHYQLDDFTIYTSLESSRHPYEMIRLSALNILNSVSVVLVDGYLVNNGERRHVENLALCRVSVTYGDNPESHFQQPEIWVQSRDVAELGAWTQRKQVPPNTYQRALSKVWYTLGKPSVAYARYYNSFKWVVTLGIHFFDFLEARAGEGGTQSGFSAGAMTKFGEEPGDIVLLTFKEDFGNWLRQKAKKYSLLQSDDYHKKWLTEYGRSSPDIPDGPIDFRHAVAGHKDWLWNQLLEGGVEWAPRVRNFTLWREIHTLDAIPYAYPGRHIEDTVVTPYVHSVFKGLYGPYLKQVKPFSPHMGSAKEKSSRMIGCVIGSREYVPKLGDVVAFDSDKNTAWTADKDFANTGSLWYGWVTKIHEKTLDIVWLYSSKDTILFKGEYPWQNEVWILIFPLLDFIRSEVSGY
jgi:DNA (cytosine-5)-methyltransferase 1